MKKYIILALVALLAAVLFVACDNDVKVDNNTAYTEVLESEGAFVVNGKGYDTLQSAIQAAVDGKMVDPVVITMTRNITSRPVVIPEGAEIKLDLGGHKLTFIDVEETAFFVGKAYFVLENGAVALLDETAELRLIHAEDDARVILSHIAPVTGCVDITGSYLDVDYCYLNDLRMTNSRLDVNRSGHVVLTSIVGDNHFVVTDPDTAITNETEVDIDDDVESGVCYIQRGEVISYYGSLQAALDDLDADNLTIIFRDDYDESELAVEAGAGRPVIIDLNGYTVTVASIKADGALTIVNFRDSATFKGNITAAGPFLVNRNVDEDGFGKVVINGAVTAGGLGIDAFNAEFNGAIETTGRVEVVGCTVNGDVSAEKSVSIGFSIISSAEESGILVQASEDISMSYVDFDCVELGHVDVIANKGGNILMTNCTGTAGDITARNVAGSEPGTITIDNSVEESGELTTGALISADFADDKFGNIYVYGLTNSTVTVTGVVAGATVTAERATFNGNITATGLISISNSTIGPDEYATTTVQTSSADVDAQKAIELSNVSFTKKTNTEPDPDVSYYADVKATAGGSISLDNCSGDAGQVVSSKSVTIPSTAGDFRVLYIDTKDLTVTSSATGLYASSVRANGIVTIDAGSYGYVGISGSSASIISGGEFGYYVSLLDSSFTYNGTGTGTLTVTGGDFYGTTKFLSGSSIVLNGTYSGDDKAKSSNYSLYFSDIDAVTDNVHIKCAYIEENRLADVEKLVHRINQNGSGQQIYINYNPYGIENLTGVDNVFDMTSANIQGESSACLNFTMVDTDDYETDNVVTSGLIVGSEAVSTPASATFNYNNGSGKKQLVVTGRIGLFKGYENAVFSTQLHDDFIYMCTYELVDDNEGTDDDVYGYVIRDDVYGVASMAGYYEYRYNGN